MKRADVERFKFSNSLQTACFMTTCYRAFLIRKYDTKRQSKRVSIEFCSPADVFKPNIASIRNAIKCCEQIAKLDILTDEAWLNVPDEYKVQYWREVIVELNAL